MEQTIDQILAHPLSFSFSLLLIVLALFPIEAILNSVRDRIQVPRPRGLRASDNETWDKLAETPGPRGGRWIGILERLFLFIALLLELPELVIAWLGFKVASKWEVWANLYKVPEVIRGLDPLDFFLARTRMGARVFQRFLIGTLSNVATAAIGLGLFKVLARILRC
jgi:hypothetical protein